MVVIKHSFSSFLVPSPPDLEVVSEKPLTGEFLMDSVKNNETKETAVE